MTAEYAAILRNSSEPPNGPALLELHSLANSADPRIDHG
jgi:hypothetical protein